jgi:hypothetical protein
MRRARSAWQGMKIKISRGRSNNLKKMSFSYARAHRLQIACLLSDETTLSSVRTIFA